MSTPTDITITAHPGQVALQLHTPRVELRITSNDAHRIASELDKQIREEGKASVHTIHIDEHSAVEVDTATARRLIIELHDKATAADDLRRAAEPRRRGRKTDKERAYINDSIALSRARTAPTAIRIAAKMIADGQEIPDVLNRLWTAAHNRGWRAGIDDAFGDD
ncbi:hypothetical protein [Microbacterium gorillae]|uniref:hypothetical protein n=1 Tax=Microbacterium gorillae TaxID=1231063 RepID=UPI003D97D445